MSRPAPCPPLHSAPLVRQLSQLACADFPASRQNFAQRLGRWLDVQDAITLSATLHPSAGRVGPGDAATTAPPANLDGALAAVRDTLRAAILSEEARLAGRSRLRLPSPDAGESLPEIAEFATYQRYYVAHQRDMEAQISPLRATLRAALARLAQAAAPQLRQLALLDAALDKALAERERALFASIPLLLERRFQHLRAASRPAQADSPVQSPSSNDSPPAADPARWLQPGGALARFRQEMQQLLLAELDLRLQPLTGLAETYRQAIKKTHS